MSEGFLMNIETAMVAFRFFARYKVDNIEDRVRVLREITKRKKAKYIRDTKDFLKGKNVVVVRKDNNKK